LSPSRTWAEFRCVTSPRRPLTSRHRPRPFLIDFTSSHPRSRTRWGPKVGLCRRLSLRRGDATRTTSNSKVARRTFSKCADPTTSPVIACFSLCDNRIEELGNSGRFRVIGGENGDSRSACNRVLKNTRFAAWVKPCWIMAFRLVLSRWLGRRDRIGYEGGDGHGLGDECGVGPGDRFGGGAHSFRHEALSVG